MKIQILFIILFALNMLLIWGVRLSGKFRWYRWPGNFIFAVLPLLTVLFPQPLFDLDYFWWKIAGAAAIILGAGAIIWANQQWKKTAPDTLITTGPYQYLRHPIYLGLIFIIVGWWWLWAAVYSFYFGMFILALIWAHAWLEEKLVMEKKFGDKFRAWRQETGMFWIR